MHAHVRAGAGERRNNCAKGMENLHVPCKMVNGSIVISNRQERWNDFVCKWSGEQPIRLYIHADENVCNFLLLLLLLLLVEWKRKDTEKKSRTFELITLIPRCDKCKRFETVLKAKNCDMIEKGHHDRKWILCHQYQMCQSRSLFLVNTLWPRHAVVPFVEPTRNNQAIKVTAGR